MTQAVAAPPSPYKGLAAFADTELDALLFFGREADTDVIAANLLAARFTVLYGPTGVGKSSVLRAGVARRVRALAPDAHVVVHDSWAGDAVESLWRAVTRELPGDDTPEAAPVFVDRLQTLLDQFGGHLYLVLDQFEELFVYPEAPAFAEALADVVRSDLRVHVLVAMREDALAELDVFTGRLPDVFGNHLPLDRLDRAAGAAAITGPIARYNELSGEPPVQVEPELVDAALEEVEVGRVVLADAPRGASDAGGSGIEAPYLQLVMQRVWETERERESIVLRRSTLDELGGAQAIVRSHLDRAVGELAPQQQDVAARIFNHLVTPSGTKVAHRVTDLAQYAGVDERELQPVLTSLGAERILRPLDGRFEIFHDVLADAVLAWRTRHEANRALEAQRADAERRHRRLLRLLGASLVALGAMAAIAVYALSQRGEARDQAAAARLEARRAKASGLNAEASVQIPVTPVQPDPELGLLLAAEAARLAPSARGDDILRRALLVSHLRRVLPERGVTAAAFSRDGDRIVVGTAGGQVGVYGRNSGRRTATLEVGNPVTALSPSPDGRLVLASERDSAARLWNLATGTELDSFDDSPNAAFSPDGDLIVTFGAGSVGVWLTRDGSLVADLFEAEADAVRNAFFGPRGTRVATTGAGRLVRVFEARTGRLLANLDQGGAVTGAAFTPDERLLVTAGQNRTARVWALGRRGRLLRELRGHRGQVTGIAVSPDGTRLVTTSTDSSARVWSSRPATSSGTSSATRTA